MGIELVKTEIEIRKPEKESIWFDANRFVPSLSFDGLFHRSRWVLVKGRNRTSEGLLTLGMEKDRMEELFWIDRELFIIHNVSHWAEL